MVHFSSKLIKGRPYLYAVHSFRLPDGSGAKASRRVEERRDSSELRRFFEEREALALAAYAKAHYAPLCVREPDALLSLERMRAEYRRIIRRLSEAQRKDLFDRFTANFTYESNALEGNSLTLKDVAIVLFENGVVSGKDLREIYETRNSREVVDLVVRNKFPVSEKNLLKMHALLMRDMRVPLGYKKVPNYLHGRQVLPSPPENVPKEMADLLKWLGDNRRAMHPLQFAARFHGRLEGIPPFEDGNGRVGRFAINSLLVGAGYPPLIIRKTQRLSYFNALADFDDGKPQSLENFLFQRLKETHEKFFKTYAKYV